MKSYHLILTAFIVLAVILGINALGGEIEPQIDYSQILIVFDETGEKDISTLEKKYPKLENLSSFNYPWPNFRHYSLDLKGNEAESLLGTIRNEQNVLSAYPAFIKEGDVAFLDNQLILNLDTEEASTDKVLSIIQAYSGRIVEEINLISSICYVITVPSEINIFAPERTPSCSRAWVSFSAISGRVNWSAVLPTGWARAFLQSNSKPAVPSTAFNRSRGASWRVGTRTDRDGST